MDADLPAMLRVDGRCTGLHVRRATRFWSRAAGLWATSTIGSQPALELRPCAAIHTLALGRSIDVVFVAADGTVLRVVPRLGPWRVAILPRAAATWELPAGTCAIFGVRAGSRLQAAAPGAGSADAGHRPSESGR